VASTREAPLHGPTTEWHVRSGKTTPVLQQPSVFLHLDAAAAGGPLHLRTAGGDFDLDPRVLRPFRAEHFLDGGVRVERVPVVVRVGPARRGQQDFPALVATRAGALWIAWQEFDDAGDAVYARKRVEGSWGEPEALARNADVFRTALAEDARGRVWAIWAEQLHGDWELVGRCHDGARWSPPERLTRAPGPDLYHRAVTDARGRLWLLGRCSARIRDRRGTLYPFQVECAACRDPRVRRAALWAHEGKRVLVVELRAKATRPDFEEEFAWAGIDRVHLVRRLPVDPRHNAKVDYGALKQLLQGF